MLEKLNKALMKANRNAVDVASVLRIEPITARNKLKGISSFKVEEAIKLKNYINKTLKTNYTVEELFWEEKNEK